jgi:hypothetical protein
LKAVLLFISERVLLRLSTSSQYSFRGMKCKIDASHHSIALRLRTKKAGEVNARFSI